VEQGFEPIYRLKSYAAPTNIYDPPHPHDWIPNSTLVLGGDTTVLFYYLGGISPPTDHRQGLHPGKIDTPSPQLWDPIFQTRIVSTIICDTKYQFCGDNDRDCSPVGPAYLVAK
jgi:hypothetical protein